MPITPGRLRDWFTFRKRTQTMVQLTHDVEHYVCLVPIGSKRFPSPPTETHRSIRCRRARGARSDFP